ncbi:acyl-CoA N-acyltransferase [Hyaloscypha bicolor E]|uniref:Acyl-CoA N-acyltransferase n=1 Tax=Hyaloscypha bicolor E TaxID=1095630 RepID=A0A2J6SIA1_9HELO|nr:acyl-CoA N-acyltransferase [Hyaloscypha bicolor E]PMD50485.1 acyl-CoA N-acyltransferase [Hyaloscypha bicolor E]
MDEAILYDPQVHSHLIPSLVAVHVACITQPTYTIATFIPPLDQPVMQNWWEDRAKEVASGNRHIIIQMVTSQTTGKEEVAGVVMLDKPQTQTVPHTAWVEKLLVLPEWRRKGVTKRMMLKLEEVAKVEGRTLLMLDTEKDSPAELVYPRLGYIRVGEVPRYMISPLDGSLKDAVWFYKDIR